MRCVLVFDEDKNLADQKVSAYGANQPLKEDPAYKEEDIKDEKDLEHFRGYKRAMDDICTILENMVFDEEITQEVSDEIQENISGEIVEELWSILDNQEGAKSDE